MSFLKFDIKTEKGNVETMRNEGEAVSISKTKDKKKRKTKWNGSKCYFNIILEDALNT